MTASVPAPKSRTLSARRLVLLAGVAGLGVTVLLGSAGILLQPGAPLSAIAYAQGAERPMGFADIVEKVKPAVVSVRVKLASGPKMMGFEGDTPFPPNVERFFRRFGLPEGATPEERRAPREHLVTGQGSGFFISTDGYAVTNNHVVDKAETVEVTADDGKTYTAKVIGTDPRTDIALIKVDGRSDFPYVRWPTKPARRRLGACGRQPSPRRPGDGRHHPARGRDIGAGPHDDFVQIEHPSAKAIRRRLRRRRQRDRRQYRHLPSGGSWASLCDPLPPVKSVVAQLKDNEIPAAGSAFRSSPSRPRSPTALAQARRGRAVAEQRERPGHPGGRHARRRHHRRQWQSGQGRKRSRQADRQHGTGLDREIDGVAQRRGEDVLDLARRTTQPARGAGEHSRV
jgi:serine protease Do